MKRIVMKLKDNDCNINVQRVILQLKNDEELRNKRSLSYAELNKLGFEFNYSDYDVVYRDIVEYSENKDYDLFIDNLLNDTYSTFNLNHPSDYKGRSLSVSDVVVFIKNDIIDCFYVDSIGFKKLRNYKDIKAVYYICDDCSCVFYDIPLGGSFEYVTCPKCGRVTKLHNLLTLIDYKKRIYSKVNLKEKLLFHRYFENGREILKIIDKRNLVEELDCFEELEVIPLYQNSDDSMIDGIIYRPIENNGFLYYKPNNLDIIIPYVIKCRELENAKLLYIDLPNDEEKKPLYLFNLPRSFEECLNIVKLADHFDIFEKINGKFQIYFEKLDYAIEQSLEEVAVSLLEDSVGRYYIISAISIKSGLIVY